MALSKEEAKNLSILDVAHSLGMEMKRLSSSEYYWVEHDSLKINTRKNLFAWYSQDIRGDTISLVETIKGVNYKEAMHFLETGNFPEFTADVAPKEPFRYTLEPYEQPFLAARTYLTEVRGLSDETIDFFSLQGVLAQVNKRASDGYTEPALVFKYLDKEKQVIGASLQGITPNQERYEGRGYLKQILYNSDGLAGVSVDIGTPNRLVFTEAPIDLMSYYELHKDQLSDVRLVAMDGLKEATISRYFMELYAEMHGATDYKVDLTKVGTALETAAKTTTFFDDPTNANVITLAIDNDKAGREFIQKLEDKGIKVTADLPPLVSDGKKMDWNDYLKQSDNQYMSEATRDNSRLAQARRKLGRLEGELSQATQAAFSHQALTNGQPMNDKRGGAAFFKRQEQLESKAIGKVREIETQKERVERLEWQEKNKARGWNRNGSGLEMSVANIPRIKEAIDRYYAGEHSYTRETIKKYEKQLVELEAMAERAQNTPISPGVQYLIDEGLVTQWAKKPTIYFIKDLRKVAFVLQDNGEFGLSDKYQPKTEEDKEKVEELIDLVKSKGDVMNQEQKRNDSVFEKQYSVLESQRQNIIGFLEQNVAQFSVATSDDYSVQPFDMLFFGDSYVAELYLESERSAAIYVKEAINMLEWTAAGNSSDNPSEIPDYDLTLDVLERKFGYDSTKNYERLYLGEDPILRMADVQKIESYRFNRTVYNSYQELLEGVTRYLYSSEWRSDIVNNPAYRGLEEEFFHGVMSVKDKLRLISRLSPDGLAIERELLSPLLLEAISEDGESISLGTFHKLQVEKQKKSLEQTQGIIAETNVGDLPDKQEAAPLPEANRSQPLNDMSPHQTQSQPLLQFTIKGIEPSTYKPGYHPITDRELRKLNRYTQNIQQTAEWYLTELASTQLTYFYSDGLETGQVTVDFGEEHFMHLTGLLPLKDGQTAEQTLHDFAQGKGDYDHILIVNQGGAFDKLKVLPDLREVVESDAFYFDDLSTVEKLHRLDLDKAIRTNDKDLLLALRTVDGTALPASLMRLSNNLNAQLDQTQNEKIILGVYQNRSGHISQISINDTYIKDGGKEMMAIMTGGVTPKIERQMDNNTVLFDEQLLADQQLDSDGDGISNADEIRLGTDPHNANSRPGKQEEDKQVDHVEMSTVADLIASNDTKALRDHLRDGIRQYMTSDQYKNFLSTMAKFHDYSLNNVVLMMSQNPDIKQVASYQKWKTDFDRQVKKGEKGLKIWVPFTVKLKDENGQPKLDDNGKEMVATRFKFGTVFDVSQTEGKELPKPIYQLESDVLDYENLYRAARQVSKDNGVPISFENIPNPNTNGYFDPANQRIVVADKQLSQAHIMKTIFHEMAHSDLHQKATFDRHSPEYAKQELQAESVAYVVASHYGIDTSDYSFGYLTSWARDPEGLVRFEEQLKVVQEEAKSLINRIDHTLDQLKNKTLVQDKFQSKIAEAKAKQQDLLADKGEPEKDAKKAQELAQTKS